MGWARQNKKCCFCEHRYERKFSTVEHFRPKTKARAASGRRSWGYWWLGYAIENLYFCCSNCNTPKNDWFPLRGRGRRCRPRELPWTAPYVEPMMIVDPGREDPEQHMTFVKNQQGLWRMAALSDRGEVTIEKIALDRDDLDELRDAYYDDILSQVLRRHRSAPVTAINFAQRLAQPRVEFALLARAVFRAEGLP